MVESFLKYLQHQKRVSAHTITSYNNDLLQFVAFLDKTFDEPIEKADYGMVRSWIVELVEEKELEPSSINRKIATLRSYYKYLLKNAVISQDPMLKVRVLKTQKKLPSFIKEDDMNSLLDDEKRFGDTFIGWRDRLILELFYATGIRLSELLHLKDININFQDLTIKVLGKRNKERIIPFPRTLVSILNRYKEVRNKEVIMKDHGYLFVTPNGDQCYPMIIYKVVRHSLKDFPAVEKKSPHVLRHTYATHLLNKGAEINAVKDLLGHSSLAATQVYTHNSIDKLKKVFEQAHPKA